MPDGAVESFEHLREPAFENLVQPVEAATLALEDKAGVVEGFAVARRNALATLPSPPVRSALSNNDW